MSMKDLNGEMQEKEAVNEVLSVKDELEVALNIFNEATGDLVEPAIARYNKALAEFEKVHSKAKEGEKQ